MKPAKKTGQTCEKCGSKNLKSCLVTYPVEIIMKQLNVGRVAVKECLDCHHYMPTKAGQEKINRCAGSFMHLLIQHGSSPV